MFDYYSISYPDGPKGEPLAEYDVHSSRTGLNTRFPLIANQLSTARMNGRPHDKITLDPCMMFYFTVDTFINLSDEPFKSYNGGLECAIMHEMCIRGIRGAKNRICAAYIIVNELQRDNDIVDIAEFNEIFESKFLERYKCNLDSYIEGLDLGLDKDIFREINVEELREFCEDVLDMNPQFTMFDVITNDFRVHTDLRIDLFIPALIEACPSTSFRHKLWNAACLFREIMPRKQYKHFSRRTYYAVSDSYTKFFWKDLQSPVTLERVLMAAFYAGSSSISSCDDSAKNKMHPGISTHLDSIFNSKEYPDLFSSRPNSS